MIVKIFYCASQTMFCRFEKGEFGVFIGLQSVSLLVRERVSLCRVMILWSSGPIFSVGMD